MTDRRGYYDIALFIPGTVTLARFKEILEELDDIEVYSDYATLDFQADGVYFETKTSRENVTDSIASIKDVVIDWDTMADWELEGVEP